MLQMHVLLIGCLISAAFANDTQSGQYKTQADGPIVSWSLDSSSFEATLTMQGSPVWMSLGVSSSGKMIGSDAFIAVGRQIYRVQLGPSGPESGAFQTVAQPYADGSLVQNGSNTILNIRRHLDTDQVWQVPINPNQPISLITAWRTRPSPSGYLGQHDGRHSQVINNDGAPVAERQAAKVERSESQKEFTMPNSGLHVSYSINDDKITFSIVANSPTWIGIGFAEKYSMHPSLSIIGQQPNQVQAYILSSDSVGVADTQLTNELTNVNFQSSGESSKLQFTRPLQWAKSGLSKYYQIDPNGDSIVISATGQSTGLAKHTAYDMSKISWNSGASSSKASKMRTIGLVHGAIMILSWLFLMPIGGVIARFFKDGESRWFRFHRAIMLSAVALTFISFVLIVWARAGKLFDSTHGALGTFVVFLAFMQPLLSMCRNRARQAWKFQHRATGVLLYLGAVINCYLGASLIRKSSMTLILTTIVTTLLVLCIIVVLVLQVKRGRSSHQAESDIKEEDENRTRAF